MISLLYPHLHDLLVRELRSTAYDGLTPDQAFKLASRFQTVHRLGSYRFLTESEYLSLPESQRPERFVLVPYDLVEQFVSEGVLQSFRLLRREVPNNIPGFPNKLRRPDFDQAWSEARPF